MQTRQKITPRQRRAFELWVRFLADELLRLGFDMRTLKIEIEPSPENVRENIVKSTMNKMYGYKSTDEMTPAQLNELYDTLNKAFGQTFGIHVPFPSIESFYDSQNR